VRIDDVLRRRRVEELRRNANPHDIRPVDLVSALFQGALTRKLIVLLQPHSMIAIGGAVLLQCRL
jgi:hypothetical protein